MLRFKLRTLLMVLAIGPMLLAWGWVWGRREYARWEYRREQQRVAAAAEEMRRGLKSYSEVRQSLGGTPLPVDQREQIVRLFEEQNRKSPPP